jgi:DNA-binding transcriptional ArsR family regulator
MLKRLALDRIFHALSDPTRRWIVEDLCSREATVQQLAVPLPVALPTILTHLKVLERSGLIRTRKIGRERSCCIEPQALRIVDEWVTHHRHVWDRPAVRQDPAQGGAAHGGSISNS